MKGLLCSDEEIRELVLEGLVSQFLAEYHADLLRSLRLNAEAEISKFNSTQLRGILVAKMLHPDWTWDCILKSYC